MDYLQLATQLKDCMHQFASLCDHPDTTLITEHEDAFIMLEHAWHLKTRVDACFAKSADLARAGNRVGSSRTVDYLMEVFDLDWRDAHNRLKLGERFFPENGEPTPIPDDEPEPAPGPSPDSSPGGGDETPDGENNKDEGPKPEPEPEPEPTRRRVTDRKVSMLLKELEALHPSKQHLTNELFAEGYEEAKKRKLEDLREWIRNKIRSINATVTDPNYAWDHRFLRWSQPDANGQVRIYGSTTADQAALLESLLANSQRPKPVDGKEDTRTLAQRRHDGLFDLLQKASSHKADTTGAASLVVTITVEDLERIERLLAGEEVEPFELVSNTNYMLALDGLERLGISAHSFLLLLDDNGLPLKLGRTKRLASLAQRVALAASQGVCAKPGCTQPACNCDVHHLTSWRHGGNTDIDNLTLLCRAHHHDVNDDHDGSRCRGHYEKDPTTGDTVYYPPPTPRDPHPTPEVNDTDRARQYPGGRIRGKNRDRTTAGGSRPPTAPNPGTTPGPDCGPQPTPQPGPNPSHDPGPSPGSRSTDPPPGNPPDGPPSGAPDGPPSGPPPHVA